MINLRDNPYCYVCGTQNPVGLGIDFNIDHEARIISASFTPADMHQGFEGIVHGGVLSAILDEAMAKLAFNLRMPAVTAEIIIKFKAPAAVGDKLIITGKLTQETKRLIFAEAKIERGHVLVAEATGKLLRISASD